MVPAYLIYGVAADKRADKLSKLLSELNLNNQTAEKIDIGREGSIGIDEIRSLKHQLHLKSFTNSSKIAIVNNAQNLTAEAANALLKTLEEPPANSIIFLEAPTKKQLPATIISRCWTIFASDSVADSKFDEKTYKITEKILKSDVSLRFEIARGVVDEADKWLQTQIIFWRQLLLTKQNCAKLGWPQEETAELADSLSKEEILSFLGQLLKTWQLIDQNINARFALEMLLLTAPKISTCNKAG